MTSFAGLVADALVNLFGAGGALIVAAEAARLDPHGSVTRRIVFALRFVALFFLVRAFAWDTGSGAAGAISAALASATPLVSLIVAEGMMRRHAPRAMKIAVALVALAGLLVAIIPFLPAFFESAWLLCSLVGGYALVALFLWRRDVTSLSTAENAAIRNMMIALAFLTPLIATDFRSLWPDLPVRLGALGALLVMYIGFGPGGIHGGVARRLGNVAVFAAVGVIFGFGYLLTGQEPNSAQWLRAISVGIAGLLFAALYAEAQGARTERSRPGASLVDAKTPEEFLAQMRRHALFADARILQDGALDQVRHPDFESLLSAQRILPAAAAPWGRAADDDGVERCLSLLLAYEASHLLLLTRQPLRILAISVPATAVDARAENEMRMARRIGEIVYEREARG